MILSKIPPKPSKFKHAIFVREKNKSDKLKFNDLHHRAVFPPNATTTGPHFSSDKEVWIIKEIVCIFSTKPFKRHKYCHFNLIGQEEKSRGNRRFTTPTDSYIHRTTNDIRGDFVVQQQLRSAISGSVGKSRLTPRFPHKSLAHDC